jgi:hypothetical protein
MSLVVTDNEPRMKDLSPEYAEIMVLGKVLQASGYFKDVRDQAQAVTKILFGRELGVSPISSMSTIHVVEGKPTLSAHLLAALIKRSGKYDYRIKKHTALECSIMFLQKVGEIWEELGLSDFTIEDAKTAGVYRQGSGWTKYPKAMLFARAISQGHRAHCPDVSLAALYVPEELGAEVNESGEVVSLPASNRDVPRTTEPIPVSGPVTKTAADSGEVKGQAEPPKVAVAQGAPVVEPPREPGEDDGDETIAPLADAIERVLSSPDELIDLPRQRALHREFRDALTHPRVNKQAPTILRNWLKMQGYVGPDGDGSTKTIPSVLFDEVKTKALIYANEVDYAEKNRAR